MDSFVEKENIRKILACLEKISEELEKNNELKQLELEMRKFWIDRKVNEWKYSNGEL